jgi:HD-GYP domain-containing protein (c-di-GMP phosphodiesterase class II)
MAQKLTGNAVPDPAVERLLEDARERLPRALDHRDKVVEVVLAILFLAVAIPLASRASLDSTAIGPAVVLVVAYAIASRVEFALGAGYGVPTQVVFVPMLFVADPAIAPALVAGAFVLGTLTLHLRGRVRADRVLLAAGNAWYAIGPAVVLTLAGTGSARWADWPIYVAALAAQFVVDGVVSTIRGRIGLGIAPRLAIAELRWVFACDALLAPIGLMAAFAAATAPYTFALAMPLLALLALFARERSARLDQALELSHAYRGTAMLLGDVVEADDKYTGDHSRDVVSLSLSLGDALGLPAQERLELEFAALLHDVGKLAIPKEIINKPGPLTDEERALVNTHTIEGYRMLKRVGGRLERVGIIVRASHERWDGGGYPDGLAGEEIPLPSRIVACADAFNAMTTDRPYRAGRTVDEAMEELLHCSGTQFDPRVVEAMIVALGDVRTSKSCVPAGEWQARTAPVMAFQQ